MELAETKYRTLVESKQWMEPTTEEKKIVALTAQIAQLKKQKKKNNQNSTQNNNGNNNNDNNSGSSNSETNNRNQQRGNSSKKTPWYWVAPKTGEPHTKKVGEKEYHWCPHHGKQGKWVRHNPSECKAKDKSKNQGQGQETSGQPSLQVNSMAAEVPDDDF